jgi:hypothetical protein
MQPVAGNLTPIFATPFASLQLPVTPGFNGDLQQLLDGRVTAQYRCPNKPNTPLLFQSSDDLFEWREPSMQQLRAHLLRALASVVAACNEYTEEEFGALEVQARAHFARVAPGGFLPTASYAQATWCAVYCVAAPELTADRPLNAVLRLYETRLANSLLDASNWRLKPPYALAHQAWRPTPGYMAVFPASLPHEVSLLHGRGDLLLVIARARFAMPGQSDLPPW